MVRTRFAPSPTGFLHIGSLRTAAYAYALAKHNHGQFLLRIEDTDQKREVSGAVDGIYHTLQTFGLSWDADPIIQTQRAQTGVYIQAAEQLVANGHAFFCNCEGRNSKKEGYSDALRDPCRNLHLKSGAIKLKVPDGQSVSYSDYVLGKTISWNTDHVPDTTLLKSSTLSRLPTYHLAMPVDDHFMTISHVLRGHDWLPSTPVHLLVFNYLGYDLPHIGHLTDIQSPQGGKLSKRRDSVSCEQFFADGYLPEALLNFVILLGWAPKDNRELFTLEEFVEHFDSNGFQKSNPLFTLNKLDWFNGHYIRQRPDTELTRLVKPYVKREISDNKLSQYLSLVKDRMVKLSDFPNLTSFLDTPPNISSSLFPHPSSSHTHLTHALERISSLSTWSAPSIESGWTGTVKSQGWPVGDYFMSLRLALCGSRQTPPTTAVMLALGQPEVISRISHALTILTSPSA